MRHRLLACLEKYKCISHFLGQYYFSAYEQSIMLQPEPPPSTNLEAVMLLFAQPEASPSCFNDLPISLLSPQQTLRTNVFAGTYAVRLAGVG